MNATATRHRARELLVVANGVRTARKEMRLAIAAGEISPARVIEDGVEGCVAGVKVFAFLTWLPGVGETRAAALLRKAELPGHRRLEQLSDRQLACLAQVIRGAETMAPGRHR